MNRFLAPLALAAAVSVAAPATAAVIYTGAGAAIPDNSFTLSSIEITDSFLLDDVNVRIDGLAHNYSGDVQFYLSKGDVTVQLFKNYGFNFYMRGTMVFDDEAATPITSYPTVIAAAYRPTQALSAFDGLDAKGIWTLKAADTSSGSSGSYTGWALEMTKTPTAVPEPASWALMILGFGAAGAMLRQRRQALVA